MKTIAVSKKIRHMLGEYADDGETMSMAVSRLLYEVGQDSVSDVSDGTTNINLDDDVLDRLKGCRAYSTETYNAIFYRYLQQVLDRSD